MLSRERTDKSRGFRRIAELRNKWTTEYDNLNSKYTYNNSIESYEKETYFSDSDQDSNPDSGSAGY
jgi:hypothetical protein